MNEELQFQKAFSQWKIWIAIFLGVSIASWMIYRSLDQKNFIFSEKSLIYPPSKIKYKKISQLSYPKLKTHLEYF